MPDITITYATIGGSRIAVVSDEENDNQASTLLTSFADPVDRIDNPLDYNKSVAFGGIQISISLFKNPDSNPSTADEHVFYAIDIIENNEIEDDTNPSNILTEGTPSDPTNKTFTWNGNRLGAAKKNEKYYMKIVDNGGDGKLSSPLVFMGVPMALGNSNELILNKTSYIFDEIEEFKEALIGGSPLTIGRIGIKYYLVVSPGTNPSA